jgi:hypothetical protein
MEEPAVPVGPFHHGGDREAVGLMGLHFMGAVGDRQVVIETSFLRHAEMIFAPCSTAQSPAAQITALRSKPGELPPARPKAARGRCFC